MFLPLRDLLILDLFDNRDFLILNKTFLDEVPFKKLSKSLTRLYYKGPERALKFSSFLLFVINACNFIFR